MGKHLDEATAPRGYRPSGCFIASLVGVAIVAFGILLPIIPSLWGSGGSRRRLAKAVLKSFAVALERYSQDFGAFPPDDMAAVGGSAEHGKSEALVHYLGQAQPKGELLCGPYFSFKNRQLPDEDSDGFQECRDPWGRAYVCARRSPPPDVSDGETPPRLFDIASPGPDGILGGRMVPGKGYVPATTPEGKAAEADNVTSW